MSYERDVILLVEDNPADVRLTLRALERAGLRTPVATARDGAEALDYLLGEPARPQPTIVLLDLKLPRVDGLEVLRRVRAEDRTRRTPVVVLTSSREPADLARAYDLGANSYVRKPVDSAQFAEVVRQLGLYWLQVNERPTAN